MYSKETQYGFDYGCAKIVRMTSDEAKGWVIIGVETPKYSDNMGVQVYVTKTGKVRIFDSRGEWTHPKPADTDS